MVLPSGNDEIFKQAINQGHSAAWEQRWQQAIDHYATALKEFPENSQALNSLALAHFELGNMDQALELYQRSIRFSPEDPLPVERSAQIFKKTGQIEKAAEYSMKAADLYLGMRDADKAIHNWTRVVGLQPENIEAHSRLAIVYERLGRAQLAISQHIAVASLLQFEGRLEEAQATGEHALSLDPKNKEAIQAVDLLNSFISLPKPTRKTGATGPLRLPLEKKKKGSTTQSLSIEDGPDPIEEASQNAIQILAGMLFELSAEPEEQKQQTGSLRTIAKVVTAGLLTKNFDEDLIVRNLSETIDLQRKGEFDQASKKMVEAIDAGLDHPAAHFDMAYLLSQIDQRESAQRSFQQAVKHSKFTLASRLQMGDFFIHQNKMQEAAIEYMQALRFADAAVVDEKISQAIKDQYDPLIETISINEDPEAHESLCKNIRHLLWRPNWRFSVKEARAQLPSSVNGNIPLPLAEILSQSDSGKLVDAMANINRIANAGFPRAAIEETFFIMDNESNYLPLHINMGEMMLMQDNSEQASEKFATVARLYSARGESDRATQIYKRIVDVSPLNTDARKHLIEQMTASGDIEGATSQYLEMADVYYRLAQLDEARESYEQALKMVQSTDLESTWTSQILHQMADIDLQRLDWRKALRVYEQLRTLDMDDEIARLKLVQLNLGLRQSSKADSELDNYLSYLNSRSQDDAAGAFLLSVVEENKDYIMGRRRLAEFYQQSGVKDKAIKEWNKVGEMLVASGDREGAKVAVRAILSMNPPNAEKYQKFLKRIR